MGTSLSPSNNVGFQLSTRAILTSWLLANQGEQTPLAVDSQVAVFQLATSEALVSTVVRVLEDGAR